MGQNSYTGTEITVRLLT